MTLEEIFTGATSANKWRELGKYLRTTRIKGGVGIRVMQNNLGTIISGGPRGGSSAVGESVVCPFGQIITYTEAGTSKQGIRGGIIHCGDKNLEIPTQFTNPAVAGEWLVYIELTCKANRDDGNKIFLPGMETATAPAGAWGKTVWTVGASYPDNTPPVVGTGSGKIILPMGRLTISNTGDISLAQSGCGNFTVSQCAGTLSYSRA